MTEFEHVDALSHRDLRGEGSLLITLERRDRVLKCERVFGVALEGKARVSGMEEGIGDAFLVDLCSNIFAVADSSDRNTAASKRFLLKFREVVSGALQGANLRSMTNEALSAYVDLLKSKTEALLITIGYHDNAAFSGMVVCAGASGNRGVLFHCGDTRVYLFDRSRGKLTQLTRTDSCLVGRISSMSQVEVIDLEGDARLLFASDGIGHLDRQLLINGGESLSEMVERILHCCPIEDVPETLMRRCKETQQIGDDICLVAVGPSNCPARGPVLIGGGTSSAEEKHLRRIRDRCPPGTRDVIDWADGQVLDLAKL